MSEALRDALPCPACGSPAVIHGTSIVDSKATRWYVSCRDDQGHDTCWIGPTLNDREKAVEAWNALAAHPSEAGLAAKLRARLEESATGGMDPADAYAIADEAIAALAAAAVTARDRPAPEERGSP